MQRPSSSNMEEILKDKRFAHVAKDPRFGKMPVRERKVKIDNRFKSMFKDKRFKLKYSVDKRGRPVNLTTNENLKKFYELSDDESSDNGNEHSNQREVASDSGDSDFDVEQILENKVKGEKILKDSRKKKGETVSNNKSKVQRDKKELQASKRDIVEKRHTSVKQKKKKSKKQEEEDVLDRSDQDFDSEQLEQSISKKTIKHLSKTSDPRFQVSKLHKKMECIENKKKDTHGKAKGTNLDKRSNSSDVDMGKSEEDLDSSDDEEAIDSDDDSEDDSSDDEEEEKPLGNDSGVDFARGEGNISSSSSDDDDNDSDDDAGKQNENKDESDFDHRWGELDDNVVAVEEATSRLAVCNMDWDRIKAKDIYALLNSFKPTNGLVKSVKIYPSEFGKERIAVEATQGPRELKEMKVDSDEEDKNVINEEGTVYHREKLRQYQLNRLKYYYAVVECDSTSTADHIYKECDCMEYESSSTKLDLRFIPEEETFDEADTHSECHEMPANYKPQFFVNAALSQSKVDLTWDETDRDRIQLITQQFMKKGEDDEEEDLKAYLASSSDEEGPYYSTIFEKTDEEEEDEEDEDEDRKLSKYKQLLTEIDKEEEKKKKKDIEMEISWEPGLREATENLVKKKKEAKTKTVWEDYLKRKKEKKRQKMEERKKKKQRQEMKSDSEDEETEKIPVEGEEIQTFSDDDLPVDEDMAAFMAEERGTAGSKNKDKKKKKKKKKTAEEKQEDLKEKEELSLLMMDEEDNKKHFNLRDLMQEDGKKKKKKQQKEQKPEEKDDFQMNVKDPRFSAMYESYLFNIDPSAPEYRKTKGMEAVISEKLQRRGKWDKLRDSMADREDEVMKKQKLSESKSEKDVSLESLIKSVKAKTEHFKSNKSKR